MNNETIISLELKKTIQLTHDDLDSIFEYMSNKFDVFEENNLPEVIINWLNKSYYCVSNGCDIFNNSFNSYIDGLDYYTITMKPSDIDLPNEVIEYFNENKEKYQQHIKNRQILKEQLKKISLKHKAHKERKNKKVFDMFKNNKDLEVLLNQDVTIQDVIN